MNEIQLDENTQIYSIIGQYLKSDACATRHEFKKPLLARKHAEPIETSA
jgi:hypothetical protein